MFRSLGSVRRKEGAGGECDGVTAFGHISLWITNADTKCGFLAAASTLLGTGIVAHGRAAIGALPVDGLEEMLALALIAVSGVSLFATVVSLIFALTPRMKIPPVASRFAFPYLAVQVDGFVPPNNPNQRRAEVWAQARTLAVIAMTKFSHFRRGLRFFTVAAAAFSVAYILGA